MNEVLSLDTDPFLKDHDVPARQREIPAHSHVARKSPPWPTMTDDDDDLEKFRLALEE